MSVRVPVVVFGGGWRQLWFMLRVGLMVVGLAGAGFGLVGCGSGDRDRGTHQDGSSAAAEVDPVLATVGGEVLRESDLQVALEARGWGSGASEGQRAALLRQLAEQRALAQAARESGFAERPSVRLGQEAWLAQHYREALVSEAERRAALGEGPPVVTDAEVEALFAARAAAWQRPARIRLAIIALQPGEELGDAWATLGAKEPLGEVAGGRAGAASWSFGDAGVVSEAGERAWLAALRALPSPVDRRSAFSARAAQSSLHQASRYRGGDVGYFIEGESSRDLPEAVVAEVFSALRRAEDRAGATAGGESLSAGDAVSAGAAGSQSRQGGVGGHLFGGPVLAEGLLYHWHVVEGEPARTVPFSAVAERLRSELEAQRAQDAQAASLRAVLERIALTAEAPGGGASAVSAGEVAAPVAMP